MASFRDSLDDQKAVTVTLTPPPAATPTRQRSRLATVIIVWLSIIAALWLIEVVDYLLPADLDRYGVMPRDPGYLLHIPLVPLLHAGFDHLSANTLPLLVLGFLTAMAGLSRFGIASALIIAVSGLGVWIFEDAHTITVGASGLVFGYFGYLVAGGAFNRRMLDIVIALVVVVLYGSILWGVLPAQPGISWLGHSFGLIGGVLAAWLLRVRRPNGNPT
ncbi:membrane associated rhomboid family serine protease [Stackebrandtia endophytica]|uniref:Membrane associated rhomboid family serine protease n=1 Tax=Stackebrandtia endophytica TaxID=1496996 RepID=A0A543APP8_9ACTN|nr:rhomboid family intramembrane serine protease [Stackebrandtia endophytica]TQL74553.1 membrane associated rhomboid family serine protease [Stackebrandtia endophytica]